MDAIHYLNRSVIQIPKLTPELETFLEYTDKSVQYQVFRLIKENRMNGFNDWRDKRIKQLKEEAVKKLYWMDGDKIYTYSGFADELSKKMSWPIYNNLIAPEIRGLPWESKPKFDLWSHQRISIDKLFEVGHGAVSLPTGSGKSICLINLAKIYGLKTIIAAPLTEIAEQLYKEFVKCFGAKYVGYFGGSKKQSNKLFVVGTYQSFTRVEKDSEHWNNLKKSEVFMADESHMCPASTFLKVCMNDGVAGNAYYRHFFSATQIRNDGSEKLLKGIIGPIVYEKSFEDLVKEGILAEPIWRMFVVPSNGMSSNSDAKQETRIQLYNNPKVNILAADLANKSVTLANRPTVILIEEFCQYDNLAPYLKIPHIFANSKDGSSDAVKKFNAGETDCLVGTSCISIGVDLKRTKCVIYLQGGTSEIKVKQAIGRGTRVIPGKTDFWAIDFLIDGSSACTNHALKRRDMYEDLYGKVQIVGEFRQ